MKFGSYDILIGDCREKLAEMPDAHFHCCVTSPPYFGLRDYQVEGQIGLEPTPDEFVAAMVEVFRGVWRVLRDDGVAFVNLGDSYSGGGKHCEPHKYAAADDHKPNRPAFGKPKDLMGMPWRVAFALQADGWYLRDAIVWAKPSPMPGSQRDRCTSSYEFVFQLAKKPRYYWDMEGIKEPSRYTKIWQGEQFKAGDITCHHHAVPHEVHDGGTRIPRNVWRIASEGFSDAHFATFPTELPRRCIKAATSEKGCCPECGAPWERVIESKAMTRERPNEYVKRNGEAGTGNSCANTVAGVESRTIGWRPTCACNAETVPCRVLDPFAGAGTTLLAAAQLGRDSTGIELNPEYAELARRRIETALRPGTFRDETKIDDAPLFVQEPSP